MFVIKACLVIIIFSLLASFFITFFFGSFIGRFGCFIVSNFCLLVSFLLSLVYFLFFSLGNSNIVVVELGSWICVESFVVAWNFLFDSLSVVMLFIIVSVSLLVHVFSYFYMYSDPYSNKFMSFLSLFTFFMVILVLSSNFIMLFLGWEGVGLCSFLLISFWSSRAQAVKSAVKAMLINRIGDFLILAAIMLIFIICKSVDFFVVFSEFNVYSRCFVALFGLNVKVVDVICLFLFLGAVTKSSQIFFHGWLPDAMEGPTPVSALIHAATMVTAGIFLFIRASYLFEYSFITLSLMVYFGVATIVVFSLIGLFQNDIKKIIAYSTCSQLGYMVVACGLSGYSLALFHLFNHAFFKALLFLSAGSIIHFMNNEQDLRRLNGVFRLIPLTSICFVIASLSLAGFPFLSGFYSKDAILELLFYKYKTVNMSVFIFAQIGVFLTAAYSLKILYFLFFKKNFNYISNFKRFELNFNLVNVYTVFNLSHHFPLICLSVFSIFSGFFAKSLFLGLGENYFINSIFVLQNHQVIDYEFVPHCVKSVSMLSLVISFSCFYYFSFYASSSSRLNRDIVLFFSKRVFFDSIYNVYLSSFFYSLAYKIFFILDKGFVEVFGPYGSYRFLFNIRLVVFKALESGKIDGYLAITFVSLVIPFFWLWCLLH